jgi:hypothetical protein
VGGGDINPTSVTLSCPLPPSHICHLSCLAWTHSAPLLCPDRSPTFRRFLVLVAPQAAFGAHPMSQLNEWGMDCPIHAWCIHMEECNSVCWRIGVSSDEFPSHNL